MHYFFNKFFYLHMASNYRPNGLTSASSPSWHETAVLPFNLLLLNFPYLAISFVGFHWLIPSNGFWTLLSVWMGFDADVMGLISKSVIEKKEKRRAILFIEKGSLTKFMSFHVREWLIATCHISHVLGDICMNMKSNS